MSLITTDTLAVDTQSTADLLKALQESIADLRQTTIALKKQIQNGETADLAGSAREIQAVDQLARNCMKTEVNLAEICSRNAGIVRGGYAVDMDAARVEVGCRLARLRTCGGA